MPKFIISETVHQYPNKTVRLGNTGAANLYGDAETGKFIKLTGESRYALAAAGDAIEGFITSLNAGTQDGYSIGGFQDQGYKAVTFDGLQATPGTGSASNTSGQEGSQAKPDDDNVVDADFKEVKKD